MKSSYKNQEEISTELKTLRLKRDISIEEIKLVRLQFKEDLSIKNWLQTGLKTLGKLSAYSFIKKIIK